MTPLALDPSMPVLITDPELAKETREKRASSDGDKWNEVWDGVLVMPTLPNDEHQELQARLMFPFTQLYELTRLGKVRAGVNVTDRHPDWKTNFRGPDVVVYLPENPAVNHGTHWVGGPDLAVEITSPGEDPRQKLDFYAKVNTREVLIVDRDPWAVELYQLQNGKLMLVGKSDETNQMVLSSAALPLTFQLRPGTPRPTILVTHTATGQTWTA
jgi:Uma2 family endonuclease